MKLLLVLTGGTISTMIHNQVMGISGSSPYMILEKYQEENKEKDIPEFDVIEPIRMLSECNRPEYLEKIYYGILEKLGFGKNALEIREWNGIPQETVIPYDGIIITHGSDTLSYTAAFLATVFSWISIPIVLTAADYPLSDSRSNGLKNFSDSVDFIRQRVQNNVFVIWQNKTMGANIFLASELLEADNYLDCFSSYRGQAFGEIKNGICTIFKKNTEERISELEGKLLDFHMEHGVFLLRPYPGLRYDFITFHTDICAVVHYLYHSSTACVEPLQENEDNYYNILFFAKYCKELGIDFYLAGWKAKEQRLYETNDLLLKSGLGKPLYNISPEMAYMQVLVAYNQTVIRRDRVFTY